MSKIEEVGPSDLDIGNPSFPVLTVDDHFGSGTKYQKYSYPLEEVMGDILVELSDRWSNRVGNIVEVYSASGRGPGLGRILMLALDCCGEAFAFHSLLRSHFHFFVLHIHYLRSQLVRFELYPSPACR